MKPTRTILTALAGLCVAGLLLAAGVHQQTAVPTPLAQVVIPSTSRGDLVPVMQYDATGTTNAMAVTAGGPTRTFIFSGHVNRIAQPGTVTQVALLLRADATTYFTSFQFKIARKTGTQYYIKQLAAGGDTASEVITSITPGAWNLFTLATPLAEVEVGDYLALVVKGNGGGEYDFTNKKAGLGGVEPAFNWQVAQVLSEMTGTGLVTPSSTYDGYGAGIYASMTAPLVVLAGDSLVEADRSVWNEQAATTPAAFTNDYGYMLWHTDARLTYQNAACSGSKSSDWADTYLTPRIVNLKPRIVIFGVGTNDASSVTPTSFAAYQANVSKVLQTCLGNGITPIVITSLQYYTATSVPMSGAALSRLKEYDAWLTQWCMARGIMVVDGRAILASPTNPDARNEALFGTGGHPDRPISYQAVAEVIRSRIKLD